MESVKINSLEIENVKRVRAVKIVPTQNGLTVLGGRNNQGKTSILDSIASVLSLADVISTSTTVNFSINASKFLFCPTKGHSHDSEPIGII